MSCRGLGDGPSDVCVSRLLFHRIKKRGTQHVFMKAVDDVSLLFGVLLNARRKTGQKEAYPCQIVLT